MYTGMLLILPVTPCAGVVRSDHFTHKEMDAQRRQITRMEVQQLRAWALLPNCLALASYVSSPGQRRGAIWGWGARHSATQHSQFPTSLKPLAPLRPPSYRSLDPMPTQSLSVMVRSLGLPSSLGVCRQPRHSIASSLGHRLLLYHGTCYKEEIHSYRQANFWTQSAGSGSLSEKGTSEVISKERVINNEGKGGSQDPRIASAKALR